MGIITAIALGEEWIEEINRPLEKHAIIIVQEKRGRLVLKFNI